VGWKKFSLKCVIFTTCFIASCFGPSVFLGKIHAEGVQGYVDYKLDSYLVAPGKTIEVRLLYKTEEEFARRLAVRPRSDNGHILIFNQNLNEFIVNTSSTNLLPTLSPTMSIKVLPETDQRPIKLSFEIEDTQTKTSYATSEKQIWADTKNAVAIAKLNTSILTREQMDESSTRTLAENYAQQSPKKIWFFDTLLCIVLSVKIIQWLISKNGYLQFLFAHFYSGRRHNQT
jgi:hypothetical protein